MDASDTAGEGIDADAPHLSEEVQLEQVIASGEATRSYFLASTLRDTTVPIVQATMTLAPTSGNANGSETADPAGVGSAGESAIPQVTGSFVHEGMTFAVTGEDEAALVAIDAAKLPFDTTSERGLVLPAQLSPSKDETYTLTSIMPRVFGDARVAREEARSVSADADGTESENGSDEANSEEEDDPDLGPGAAEAQSDDAVAADVEGESDIAPTAETSWQAVDCLGIPATVSDIAADAFANYEPLEYLVVAEGNDAYSSYDGVLYDADRTSLLLIPEGRQGAVRIAPTVANVPAEMFSHRSGLALVADAGSTALTSEDGFLYDVDLADFDFPVPVAITNGDSIVAATPGFEEFKEMLTAIPNEYSKADTELQISTENTATEIVFSDKAGYYSDWLPFKLNSNAPFLLQFTWFVNGEYYSNEIRSCGGSGPYIYGEGVISWINREDNHIQCMISSTEWRDLAPFSNGYTFGGFYYDQSLASRVAINASSSSITDIWLKFTPIVYSIAWNANGGSLSGQATTYNIETANYRLPTPVRAGYTFAGWDVTGALGAGIAGNGGTDATIQKGTYGNLSATAKWTRNNYTIAYTDNGGSFAGKVTSYNIESADFALPSSGTRAGYTFAGWNVSGASGTGIVGNGTVNVTIKKGTYGNLSATAKWMPVSYSVTYVEEGGTFSGKTTSYNIETADFSLPENGTRVGYTFAGWDVIGASGAGITGNGTTNVTVKSGTYGDLTVKAKWTINTYHLSWGVSHGSHSNRTDDFTIDDCPITVTSAVPDAGYSFAGWNGPNIANSPKEFEITAAFLAGKANGTTLSYAADFTANPYVITLHTNNGLGDDGLGDVIRHDVVYDDAVAPIEVPKRYGYRFNGYFIKESDGSRGLGYFDEEGAYALDSGIWRGLNDVDLYASWTLMGNLEVPINAPSTISFAVDRATGLASASDGSASVEGVLRSTMPEEVPVASLELTALLAEDGISIAEKLLGEDNAENCSVEFGFAPNTPQYRTASLRLMTPPGAAEEDNVWEFAPDSSPRIPAAVPAAANTPEDRIVEDELGNLAEIGELALVYTLKTLPGFDVYKVPLTDDTATVARIMFTVDLRDLVHDYF